MACGSCSSAEANMGVTDGKGELRGISGWTLLSCVLLLLTWSLGGGEAMNITEYLEKREMLMAQEQTMIIGQDQVLTPDEQKVNDLLMAAKMAEMDLGFETLDFPPSFNFMTVRDKIEASDVFKLIRQMPKGAALHLHDTALVSASWVVEEITYWSNLYMCFTPEDQLLLKFFQVPDTMCNWELVSDVRASYPSAEEFDAMLFSRLSLFTDNPDEMYPDINSVWQSFASYFTAITDMVMYRPAWESYLYRAMDEFSRDNILYLEFRGTLHLLYELDGTILNEEETMTVYSTIIKRYVQDHPDDFYGTRFIYGPWRAVDNSTVEGYVSLVQQLKAQFPDVVAGFDLVGQEDLGEPLRNLLEPLLKLSEYNIPVFYHAGETDWMGMSTDENVIDALLLNCTRMGHGYAITKHPEAKAMAKEKNVAVEVNPISNQVLLLVKDLRNHPAAPLVAEGFPLVISSDDPGAWGAEALSYDFYEAFMALGGAKADLRFLKQLAINSILYSSLEENSQMELMQRWQEKWDEFIATSLRLHTHTGKFFPTTTTTTTSTTRLPPLHVSPPPTAHTNTSTVH